MLIKRIGNHDLKLPTRGTCESAGLDLQSASNEQIIVPVNGRVVIPSGFAMKVPQNFVGLVWPRSGMAVKHGIDVLAGCIDSDYTGEIMVVLQNHGVQNYVVNYGDRIAQLLVLPAYLENCAEVDNLGVTLRGDNGFGSTGK